MTIALNNAGKRYNRDWIFRHLDYTFEPHHAYAITGPNGSGKSTLLQALAGAIAFNEGTCQWCRNDAAVLPEKIYTRVSLCAPYLELVEEMSLTEFLQFHNTFKPFLPGMNFDAIAEAIGLRATGQKRIGQFSSGMKQRVKLAQCVFSDTPLVLLDEPCTNLDAEGIALYQQLVARYCTGRLVIVSSNDKAEYGFCDQVINMMQYKKK